MKIPLSAAGLPKLFHLARLSGLPALFVLAIAGSAPGQISDAEAEALRKAQDPLANVKALMTDNTIGYESESRQALYNFQLQPVYSIQTSLGFNVVTRGIIPLVGTPTGGGPVGLPDQYDGGNNGTAWGLSDIMAQTFFVPDTKYDIKFGIGPQVSLRTRTCEATGGPGWGVGFGACVFGFSGALSYGGILSQHWGQDGYNRSSLQPIVFYNMDLFGGSYVGYSNSIVYDWSAPANEGWLVPVGLTAGKTFLLDGGCMVDANAGAYYLAVGPGGQPDWQFKVGLSFFFP